jgi:hypothetical protein
MAEKGHERRLDQRAHANGKVDVQYVLAGPRARDISTSGMYLYDDRPFQRGQTIELRLRLSDGEEFRVRGMVRRVDPGVGFAVEFMNLSHHDRKRLRDYLAQLPPESRIQPDEEI